MGPFVSWKEVEKYWRNSFLFKIYSIWAPLVAVNFVVFWLVSLQFGGSAISGEDFGDQSYLRNHGQKTIVSQEAYHKILLWEKITMLNMGLAVLAGAAFAITTEKEPDPTLED